MLAKDLAHQVMSEVPSDSKLDFLASCISTLDPEEALTLGERIEVQSGLDVPAFDRLITGIYLAVD